MIAGGVYQLQKRTKNYKKTVFSFTYSKDNGFRHIFSLLI
jgi:hypothetical protein